MRRPFKVGLTGSIGMGKTTTARLFEEQGIPVWEADAAVHRLYSRNGPAVLPVASICPQCISADEVDREALKNWIAEDRNRLALLESVVHPLVSKDRDRFLEEAQADIVLLDVPLLYETGADQLCDAVVVVTAPADVQRERVLARPGMTEAHLKTILERQMSDAEKRKRADYLIETMSMAQARKSVRQILKAIRTRIDA